jgi:hypothetical protein
MLVEKFIDASEMEPPEPLERALSVLAELQPGQYLHMLIGRIPYPLFDYCSRHSLEYRVRTGDTAGYDIYIWNRADSGVAGELFRRES